MYDSFSLWSQRVQQQLALFPKQGVGGSSMSVRRVQDYVNHWVLSRAKFSHSMKDIAIVADNSWVASVAVYVSVGDSLPGEKCTPQEESDVQMYLRIIHANEWSNADVLQAIEWSKSAMPNYPNEKKWASILGISCDEVISIQKTLAPDAVALFTPKEQNVWNMACDLDAPFHYGFSRLDDYNVPAIDLPDLSPN